MKKAVLRIIQGLLLLYVALAIAFCSVLGVLAIRQPIIIGGLVSQNTNFPFLTLAEQEHMHDVALLIRNGVLMGVVASVVLAISARQWPLDKHVYAAAALGATALLVLLLPFSWSFEHFHLLFFPQGNWQFAQQSWLITHFSEAFFARVAVCWVLATAGVLGVFWVVSSRAAPTQQPRRARRPPNRE